MHIVKIGLAFAVVSTLVGASVGPSFAQDGGLKISLLRAEAIMQHCGSEISRLRLGQHGNVQLSRLHGRT